MKYELKERRLSEIEVFCGKTISQGDYLSVTPERCRALQSNPFLDESDSVCQRVGFVDGKPAGFEYWLPLHVRAHGRVVHASAGSSLNVEAWARKSGLGMDLPALRPKREIDIAASCSQMSIPVHQMNDFQFFFFPRFVALWKSRSVLEMFVGRLLGNMFGFVADRVIDVYACVLKFIAGRKLRDITFEAVRGEDEETIKQVSSIAVGEGNLFTEEHDAAWFKWHLTNSFSKDGPCRLFVARREGTLIGFYMDKKRFHKQASHRGFRDVWLGSLMEWGSVTGEAKSVPWIIVHAALNLRKERMDAVEVWGIGNQLCNVLRRIGWRAVGEGNVGFHVDENSPLSKDKGIWDIANWRIRPAVGDNGLS